MNEKEEIIELFGHRVKIVSDDNSNDDCEKCILRFFCRDIIYPYICQKEDGTTNRHFEKI